MASNLSYDDLVMYNSELIYCYNKIGVPGRYLNKITCVPYNERPDIIMKIEISLTNVDDELDTQYTFWISSKGLLFNNNPHCIRLNRIIGTWIKTVSLSKQSKKMAHQMYDIGVLYSV